MAIRRGSGQRFRRDTGACGPVARLNACVDDEQCDLDALWAELESSRVGDRSKRRTILPPTGPRTGHRRAVPSRP